MREQPSRYRDKETDENTKQHPSRGVRTVRNEPERRRPVGPTRYDDHKVGHVEKLSCLNETWARKGSTSMKFEWTNLLPRKPDISDFSFCDNIDGDRIFSENNNVGFIKRGNFMCRTESNGPLTSARYESKSPVAKTETMVSLKNDHHHYNVMYNKGCFGESPLLKSSVLKNSSRACPIACVQYDYKPQNCFRHCVVDSIAEKIEGSCSSRMVLDHYGGLDSKELNVGNESSVMEQDRECFRAIIVESIEEKIEGGYSSHKVLDHYCGLDSNELNNGNESRVTEQDRECFRGSSLDPIVDKYDVSRSSKKALAHYGGLDNNELNASDESRIMEQNKEGSGFRSSCVSKGSQAMERDGECLGSRGFHVECGSKVNLDCGGLPAEKLYGFERDGGLRLSMLNHDDVLYENVARSKQVAVEEEQCIKDLWRNSPEREDLLRNSPERGRVVDFSMIAELPRHQKDLYENEYKFQQMLAPTGEPSKGMYEGRRIVDLSMITQRAKQNISFMQEVPSNQPVKSSNIKKRLGPARNIKERLGPVQSKKKRLGPVRKLIEPSTQVTKELLMPARNRHMAVPWVKDNQFCRSDFDDLHGGGYVQGGESYKLNKKSAQQDKPPEQPEVFDKLVHDAYMMFVKALNENQAQKRKFTERGTRTLKCFICGSFSKGFVDTLSMANHAFMTKRLKAEHLGFHRALCVLMGWNYAANSSGKWIQQSLSDSEASALKQDLIIWPPVVFIHNSLIGNTNPDERMNEKIEELRAIIRGMGFGGEITKVCSGRAANQSITVVNFHGTFSGLQEADNLHKHFAENNRGRADFQQFTSQSNFCSYKVSSGLYGYLGIAEDLDKLEFEAKNRFFVRSKKEIQAIADSLLDREY